MVSTRFIFNLNQKKNCIITDLKPEYWVAIDKLQIKQQFCIFTTLPKTHKKII